MEFCCQLRKFKSTLILTLTPILLSIIFFVTSPDIYREIACAYTILVMSVYWVTEVVPLAVTALLPLVCYPLLGVATAQDVSIKYLKDVNVLFLGGLTVAIAVEHWNLHKRVALKVLTKVGAKPRWLLFGFMITTAFLSMWISNVATTAMMVPIAQAVLDELTHGQNKDGNGPDLGSDNPCDGNQTSQDKPTTYLADSLGGNENPFGLELGNNGEAQKLGFELALKRPMAPAQPQLANGHAGGYFPVAADEPNPKYKVENEVNPDIAIHGPESPAATDPPAAMHSMVHLDVKNNSDENSDSPMTSTTFLISNIDRKEKEDAEIKEREKRRKGLAKALTISVCYAANIGGTATLTGTGPNLILAGIFKEKFTEAPEVDFGSWVVFAFPGMLIFLTICWFWLQYLFLDLNLKQMFFGEKSEATEEEKRTELVIKRQYRALGSMSFAETSVLILFVTLALLWLTRDPGFVSGWGSLPIFKSKYVTDATVAMFVAFLLFVFPSKRPNFFCCRAKHDKSKSGPVPPLLTWKIVEKKMAWNVILLLGGGFAMAYGSEASGLTRLIGIQMQPLMSLPPFAANFICCLAICVMTQCTSNTATATVFLPILAQLGEIIGVNPLLLMLPSTVITSYAFMLPVSTPPNAIAYSYGHLGMSDMIKAGFLMNVIGIFIALFSVYVFGGPAFNVYMSCPDWIESSACDNTTNSITSTTIMNKLLNSTLPSS